MASATALSLIALTLVTVVLLPPRVAFLLVVGALPLEAFGRMEIGFGIPPAYVLLPCVVIGMIIRQERFSLHLREHRWLWLFLVLSGFSVLLAAPVQQGVWESTVAVRATFFRSPIQFGLLLLHVLAFGLTLHFAQRQDWLVRALRVYLSIGGALACYAVYQVAAAHFRLPGADITWAIDLAGSSTYTYGETRYYSGVVVDFAPRATFKESLHFAYYILSFLPLAWGLFARPQATRRLGFRPVHVSALALLGSVALLLTFSRSGWGAFIVALMVLVLGLKRRGGLRVLLTSTIVILAGLLLMSAVGLFTTDTGIYGVLKTRLALDRILADPRIFYLGILLESAVHHPFLGVGVGNFAITGAAAYNSPTLHSAHGIFWAACADSGIPAMAALLAFFGTILIRLRRVWRTSSDEAHRCLALGLGASLAGLLAQSFFFGDRPEMHLLFITGLAAAVVLPYRVGHSGAIDQGIPPATGIS